MEDSTKDIHRRVFEHGQETVAKEVVAEHFERQVALTGRAAQVATEVVNLANEIASDGDPHKKQIADLLKGSVLESLQVMQQVAKGKLSPQEASEVLQARPFSGDSSPSSKKLPDAHASSSEPQKALPNEPSQVPQKRKRGRPPKQQG